MKCEFDKEKNREAKQKNLTGSFSIPSCHLEQKKNLTWQEHFSVVETKTAKMGIFSAPNPFDPIVGKTSKYPFKLTISSQIQYFYRKSHGRKKHIWGLGIDYGPLWSSPKPSERPKRRLEGHTETIKQSRSTCSSSSYYGEHFIS